MRQEQTVTHVIEASTIACDLIKREDVLACSIPLFDEPLALPLERHVKRLEESVCRVMEAIPKGQAEGELITITQVQFSGQRYIPIRG
jgi:hypothetical protein